MATVRFYQNKYSYPDYSESLQSYGSSMESTPVGLNLRTGKLRIKGSMSDFMSCNYVGITRDNRTIYGWIDDVEFHTANSFYITYTVDAWRTYKSKINLGSQYIERSPIETNKFDPLLGSLKETNEVLVGNQTIGTLGKRYAVVQVRSEATGYQSNTPVQPSPYVFYFCEYNLNNWQSSVPLKSLVDYLVDSPESNYVVTMYSIPYVDMTEMEVTGLPLGGTGGSLIPGWSRMPSTKTFANKLTTKTPITVNIPVDITKVKHSVMLVIPEAGIINIPDEMLKIGNPLVLRQDIDLFSGASNYMLTTLNGTQPFHLSVRGSSVTSIPIISDPYDTYISQNQNALTTSLMGDVANIATGALTASVNPDIGLASAISGARGISQTLGGIEDAASKGYSNPPSFLGTALVSSFHQQFWIVIYKTKVDNAVEVNNNFGYPYDMFDTLTFPSSGYIQTRDCKVNSSDGSVPRWAIEEINSNFNNGILVK